MGLKWFGGTVLSIAIILIANRPCSAEKPDISVDFSGYAAIQDGEIVKGMYGSRWDVLDHQWQQFLFGGFDLDATVNKRLHIVFGPECEMAQGVYDLSGETNYSSDLESYNVFYKFYLDQMKGTYSLGELDNPYLKVTLGYFKYHYNQDVKSLGEYLFRATAYPGYIINSFASVYQRLPGLCLEYRQIPGLKVDALLTSETQYPVGDFTPSVLASYAVGGTGNHPLVEVGAGVCFQRLISINTALTTPHYVANQTIGYDTSYPAPNETTVVADTTYCSFAATKVMARFSFDPKQLFGRPGIFGDEDLKLYGEGCILGTQNYPIVYDNILKRMPVMLGFNVPTFKLLDVLSAEVEWYDSKYSNNYQLAYFPTFKAPLPLISAGEPPHYPWYWDIYFARKIIYGLQLMGDVGRTHYFTSANLDFYRDTREECPSHGDWQFTLRAQYNF